MIFPGVKKNPIEIDFHKNNFDYNKNGYIS